MNAELGVVCGRFQPFHLGHAEYVKAAKGFCKVLLVGITNPDLSDLQVELTSLHRSEVHANPFNYFERMLMIRGCLHELGIDDAQVFFTPLPITEPGRLQHYIPRFAVNFLTIYDSWGERRQKLFEEAGLKVNVLWKRSDQTRITSGSEIRRRMRSDMAWTRLRG